VSSFLSQSAQVLLALLVLLFVASHIQAWVFKFLAPSGVFKVKPEHRAVLLFLYGLLPAIISLWSVIFLFFPRLSALVVPAHCHNGDCSPHQPELFHSLLATGLLSLAIMLFVVIAAALYLQLVYQSKRLIALKRLASDENPQFKLLESPQYFAFCSGFFKPKIFISDALYQSLSHEQIQAVLSHEQAHVLHYDNLKRILLTWAMLFWPKKTRTHLHDAFDLASEESSDNWAAEIHGRATLVKTLETLATISQRDSKSEWEIDTRRLEHLHNPEQRDSSLWTLLLFLAIGLLQIPFYSSAYHVLTEWILSF